MEMDKCDECDYTPGGKEHLMLYIMCTQSNMKLLYNIRRNKFHIVNYFTSSRITSCSYM